MLVMEETPHPLQYIRLRLGVVQEIAASPVALRDYLAEAAKTLLADSRFLDMLPGLVLESVLVPLQQRVALTSITGGNHG